MSEDAKIMYETMVHMVNKFTHDDLVTETQTRLNVGMICQVALSCLLHTYDRKYYDFFKAKEEEIVEIWGNEFEEMRRTANGN